MNWGIIAQLAVVAGGLTLWVLGWRHLRKPGPADSDDWANRNSW